MKTRNTIALLAIAATAIGSSVVARPFDATVADVPDQAYLMEFGSDWTLEGDLPEYAMLITLQGLANTDQPRLYIEYPDDWTWKITKPLRGFYEDRIGIEFTRLETAEEALRTLGQYAEGYVVWDQEVRTSLIVAFTVASLERVIVVNERLIPLAEAAGLKMKADLRGEFRGMPDHEIYQIAYDRYWDRCSRDIVMWIGGASGRRMEPGVVDYGIFRGAFFCDLSAHPGDVEERALHNRILSEMNPYAVVMGWHSYAKDTEGQHVSMVSSYGLKMEGLNSLPNISFNTQIPTTDDFSFTNNHTVERDERLKPDTKVYLSFVQTDSIGIGAWTKPGRGRIPYAWQVSMNWTWICPATLQYFWESATPNDYFIAGLSGPGYMYPKPIPLDRFPGLMTEAARLMDVLDLRAFEIMDYSQGNRHVGNTDLPEDLVARYFENLPDAIGFINGYGSARTFALRDDRPMISYDYYLGLRRPEEEALADLEELMQLNSDRPYFLLTHVRESTSIERVANIVEALGDEIEVVPLDVFLKLAAANKTYRTNYLKDTDPVDYNKPR